uniref:Uncharacterized protein n=1 Tax=Anguilla anguilla TaxID=7936 RepID=A0A0E9QMI3_ANGAN
MSQPSPLLGVAWREVAVAAVQHCSSENSSQRRPSSCHF